MVNIKAKHGNNIMTGNRKVVAESNIGHTVQLISVESVEFAAYPHLDKKSYTYHVTYGLQTRDCGQDIQSAWDEFKACTQHAIECAGLLDDVE